MCIYIYICIVAAWVSSTADPRGERVRRAKNPGSRDAATALVRGKFTCRLIKYVWGEPRNVPILTSRMGRIRPKDGLL